MGYEKAFHQINFAITDLPQIHPGVVSNAIQAELRSIP